MALVKCEECGHDVSDRAASCPHCGCPTDPIPSSASGMPVEEALDSSAPPHRTGPVCNNGHAMNPASPRCDTCGARLRMQWSVQQDRPAAGAASQMSRNGSLSTAAGSSSSASRTLSLVIAIAALSTFPLSFFDAFAGWSVLAIDHPEWGVMTGGKDAWNAGQPSAIVALLLLSAIGAVSAFSAVGRLPDHRVRMISVASAIGGSLAVVLLLMARFQGPHDGEYDEDLNAAMLLEGNGWSGTLILVLAVLVVLAATLQAALGYRQRATSS